MFSFIFYGFSFFNMGIMNVGFEWFFIVRKDLEYLEVVELELFLDACRSSSYF